jgi:dTMP kinase
MRLFVVFEGIEGSGKSTQSRELNRRLVQSGYTVTLAREPGGTPTGDRIREELLGSDHHITPVAELFLFSASRTLLVESVIRPALARNEVVVCDRYAASTLAYQGFARSIDLETVERTNDTATGGLYPDLTVLLDIEPDVGLARKPKGHLDRIERERIDFHRRARDGFLELARSEPGRWLVLDGSDLEETISRAVWERVSEELG